MHTTFPLRNCSGCIGNRWQIELLIKQMKQFLLLVRLRSRHPATVRATLLAALVAWALQEEEGQALLRTLVTTAEPGQQSLVQAYLPLLEQWEAEDTWLEERLQSRACGVPVSVWLVTCQLPEPLACAGARASGVLARVQAVLATFETLFLSQPSGDELHQRLWFLAWVQQRFLATPVQGGLPLIGCLSSRLWEWSPPYLPTLPYMDWRKRQRMHTEKNRKSLYLYDMQTIFSSSIFLALRSGNSQ